MLFAIFRFKHARLMFQKIFRQRNIDGFLGSLGRLAMYCAYVHLIQGLKEKFVVGLCTYLLL